MPSFDFSYGSRKREREDNFLAHDRPHSNLFSSLQASLQKDLCGLCDPRGSQEPFEDIEYVTSRIILVDFNNSYQEFCDLLHCCIQQMPMKIPHLASVMLNLHIKEHQVISKAVIESVNSEIEKCYSDLDSLKLYIRFLICCWPIVSSDYIFDLLQNCFNISELSTNNLLKRDVIYNMMINIPYIPKEANLNDRLIKLVEKVNSLLEELDIDALHIYIQDSASDSHDRATLIVKQLNSCKTNFASDYIQRFYEILEKANQLNVELKLTLPKIPEKLETLEILEPSFKYFKIFKNQNVATVPDVDDIADSILKDIIIDTINRLEYSRSTAIRHVLDLDVFLTPQTFALRGIPLKELEANPKWKLEDIITETIFNEMLRLPTSRYQQTYYSSLLIDACYSFPKIMASSIGRSIRSFFNNLEDICQPVLIKFIEWFSLHLSNFNFTWKWGEWTEWCNLEKYTILHPKTSFIKHLMDKQIRLSYKARISSEVPQEFQKFLANDSQSFIFPFESDIQEDLANKVSSMCRSNEDNDELENFLNELDILKTWADKYRFLMYSLANSGREIVDNGIMAIEKQMKLLVKIDLKVKEEGLSDSEIIVIDSIMKYYDCGFIQSYLYLYKFLQAKLLSPLKILYWYFAVAQDYQIIGDAFVRLLQLIFDDWKSAKKEKEISFHDSKTADQQIEIMQEINTHSQKLKDVYDMIWSQKEIQGALGDYSSYWLKQIRYHSIVHYYSTMSGILDQKDFARYLDSENPEFFHIQVYAKVDTKEKDVEIV